MQALCWCRNCRILGLLPCSLYHAVLHPLPLQFLEVIRVAFIFLLDADVFRELEQATCLSIFSSGLLKFGTTDIWGKISLCCGKYPVCCRLFSSISGLHTRDASSTACTPAVTTGNAYRHCQIHPHNFESESLSVVSDSLRPHGLLQAMEFSRPDYWSW